MMFNIVDIVAIIVIASAVYAGLKLGGFRVTVFTSTFFAALWLSYWAVPRLLNTTDENLLAIVNLNVGLSLAIIFSLASLKVSKHMKSTVRSPALHKVDKAAGTLLWSVGAVAFMWLTGIVISTLPLHAIHKANSQSLFFTTLSGQLGTQPNVLAANTINNDDITQDEHYSETSYQQALERSKQSVVRVTGFGCGAILSGSGFSVGNDLIMTNAHVVAGVSNPVVNHQGKSIQAKTVLINTGLDLAILQLQDSSDEHDIPALVLDGFNMSNHKTVAILGFQGEHLSAAPGVIKGSHWLIETTNAGKNIYKNVFLVRTTAALGVSGGPMVAENGRVLGVAFARPQDSQHYAYVIKSADITDYLRSTNIDTARYTSSNCTN